MKPEINKAFSEVAALEERYQVATYKKMPIVAERGEGVWLFAAGGQKYLDLYGGHAVAGTGHSHPHVVAALHEQAASSCSIRTSSTPMPAPEPLRSSYR